MNFEKNPKVHKNIKSLDNQSGVIKFTLLILFRTIEFLNNALINTWRRTLFQSKLFWVTPGDPIPSTIKIQFPHVAYKLYFMTHNNSQFKPHSPSAVKKGQKQYF